MEKQPAKWQKYGKWTWWVLAAACTIYIFCVADGKTLFKTSKSFLKLTVYVGVACYIGAIFEYKAWSRFASFLATPLIKFGKLPKVCGIAFLTALFSNHAANSMITGSYSAKRITRTEMMISALCNSYCAMVSHSMRIFFPLFGAIGMASVAYYSITFSTGLLMTIAFLLIARFRKEISIDEDSHISVKKQKKLSWKEVLFKSWKRTRGLILRVITISGPIYFLVAYLNKLGAFKQWHKAMPEDLVTWLTPEMLAVMTARLGRMTTAGNVAEKFLLEGKIELWQIVLAFLIGNVITNPIRTVRRNLPSALGIFPGRDGLWIVLILQGLRFIFALLAIIVIVRIYV